MFEWLGGTNLLLSPLRKQQLEPLMEKGQKSILRRKMERIDKNYTHTGLKITALRDVTPSGLVGRYQCFEETAASFFRVEGVIDWPRCCSYFGICLSKFMACVRFVIISIYLFIYAFIHSHCMHSRVLIVSLFINLYIYLLRVSPA